MNKKIIAIIILVAVAAIASYVWFFVYNKSHANFSRTQAEVIISAEDLYQAYVQDEVTASNAYNGKVIEVTGIISSIKEVDGLINIYLSTSDMMAEISAELDPQHPFVAENYEVGQEVTIRGECAGYDLDVVFNRCYIVD